MKKTTLFLVLAGASLYFTSCSSAPQGEKAQVGDAKEVTAAAGETYAIDAASTVITWLGTKPAGQHTGTIAVKEGSLTVANGQITGGSFVLDMNSITCTDLKAEDGKDKLEAHLKGTGEQGTEGHFFDVTKFPTGKFEITKVTPLADGTATHTLEGNLTLKDVTKSVAFKANIKNEGGKITAEAPQFVINRTLWNITFMSKSLASTAKDKFINDEIGLSLKLSANKK